ncbi:MAG: EamA family transporter [Gammaproteobacteria bacterium]|nr:EamA family transporter [Gammaproteobacteria bacterium]
MKNTLLYALTVLIWGSTWFAIEFQLGEVAVEVSLVYRFGMAAAIMWVYCLWQSVPLGFSLRNHGFIALLALGNFSANYVLMYLAQGYLTSAMTSIAFSTLLLMNIINTRLFFGKKIASRVYVGACLGILGIVALFWNDLRAVRLSGQSLLGLWLVLGGTLAASLGNMTSVRNSNHGLNIFAVNAWGMLYGTLALSLFAWLNGSEFIISYRTSYLVSLLYLSVFGTVIAFASYFVLLKNLGPEKASYVIVLFPFVAVTLSSLYEGFVWTTSITIGFALVLLGNLILLTPTAKIMNLLSSRKQAMEKE